MKINTNYFGEVEVAEEAIIEFPEGILAFEHYKKYVLLDSEEELPFRWLQSVENPDISFIIINPFVFKMDYEFKLPDAVVEKLKIASEEDVLVYTIVVIPENFQEMTANLLAPVVINIQEKIGKQIILEGTSYHTKHKMLEETGR